MFSAVAYLSFLKQDLKTNSKNKFLRDQKQNVSQKGTGDVTRDGNGLPGAGTAVAAHVGLLPHYPATPQPRKPHYPCHTSRPTTLYTLLHRSFHRRPSPSRVSGSSLLWNYPVLIFYERDAERTLKDVHHALCTAETGLQMLPVGMTWTGWVG